jgi:polyhydroxybutyrate depolymerase
MGASELLEETRGVRHRALVTIVLLLVATGCSSDPSSDATVATPAPTSAAPTTVVPTTVVPATVSPTTVAATTVVPTTTSEPASSGCAAPPVAAGETTNDFTAAGMPGTYVQHVPPGYDGTSAVPLVLGLHGWSEPAIVLGIQSDLGAAADRDGFVAVYPDITRPTPLWDTALDGADVEWIGALLDSLEQTLCIDTDRVYVTGMSNGAMMTSTLACTMADRIAAVAPVAGVRLPDGCAPSRPVPMIAFHGTDDQYLAFDGGYGAKVAGLASPDGSGTLGAVEATGPDAVPVLERVQSWSYLDGCDGQLGDEPLADDVTLHRNEGCGVPVELYVVDGGGHTWPGSDFDATITDLVGHVTESIDATALMVEFFLSHPLH